jgi:hypothetical protein
MPLGPGVYDDICTMARKAAGLRDDSPGGVAVIVIGGDRGNGMSVQADLATMVELADVLENVVREIRRHGPLG